MRKSVARRGVIVAVACMLSAVGLAIAASPASAHDVTGIDVSCQNVTVHFTHFPDPGVSVTIAVQVGNAPTITQVDNVNGSTPQEIVDITAATSQLFGATAPVTVDVSWTYNGYRDVHQVASVTCGNTTTSGSTTTSATTTSSSSTSTTMKATTTTAKATTTTTKSTTTTTKPKSTTTTTKPKSTTTTTTTPPQGGGDVFQIELRRCTQIHTGYEHFPAGTIVRWRVKQDGTVSGRGSFVTVAGGGYHFITQSLGTMINASPDVGQVHYSWNIGHVHSHLTVTREPGCSGVSRAGESGLGDFFEVDLRRCTLLHIGYQYFPPSTRIAYGIIQGSRFKGIGLFVTKPGRGYHFLMLSLPKKLGHNTDAMITFYWHDGKGPLLHYTVHTSPGC
jgi:hypothetical protein